MNPPQFTEEFAKAISLASPSTKVVKKAALELQLTSAAGKASTVFLDNAYKEYLLDSKALKDVIQRYAASSLEARDDAAKIDRTRIIPIIKDRRWLTEIALSLKSRGVTKPVDHVVEDLNEELVIVYAEDSPKNIRYFAPKDLDAIGVSRTDLRATAVNNLRKILPKIEIHKGQVVSMVTAGGDFEASLLLFNELWSDGTFQVDGDIIVAIPARDLLIVTGSKTPGGISRMRELSSKYVQQSSYGLTDTLFVFRNGKFEVLAKP